MIIAWYLIVFGLIIGIEIYSYHKLNTGGWKKATQVQIEASKKAVEEMKRQYNQTQLEAR